MNAYVSANVANCIARTLSIVFLAFIAFFVVAHAVGPDGLPALWREPLGVQIDFVALFLMVIGGVAGWRWPGAASVTVLAGYMLWQLVQRRLPWPPSLIEIPLAVGLLYAFASWRKHVQIDHTSP